MRRRDGRVWHYFRDHGRCDINARSVNCSRRDITRIHVRRSSPGENARTLSRISHTYHSDANTLLTERIFHSGASLLEHHRNCHPVRRHINGERHESGEIGEKGNNKRSAGNGWKAYMNDSVMYAMSLSRSLYRAYGTLYDRFSTDLFTFEELRKTTGLSLASGLKCASLLRGRGYMVIFSRSGMTRRYRLLSLEQALFAQLHMNLGEVRQQRYVHLLVDACIQLHRSSLGLLGVWLFGSVARGEARPNSDVDLLVVARNLMGNKSQMADAISSVVDVRSERDFFFRNGFVTDISFYPITEEELGRFYPIMLDVLDHGIVLYERGEILNKTARSMKEWLSRMRVRKVTLKRGWMWLLPPDLKVGEPVGVQKTVKGIPRPS